MYGLREDLSQPDRFDSAVDRPAPGPYPISLLANMGSMLHLLTSFQGRIDRFQFWQGVLLVVIWMIGLGVISAALFGQSANARLFMFAASLLALYPALALGTKRLADRGHGPLPRLAIFVLPSIASSFLDTFQIGYRPMRGLDPDAPEAVMMIPGTFGMTLGFFAMGVSIWAIIELGILRGTPESNAFGPPPGVNAKG